MTVKVLTAVLLVSIALLPSRLPAADQAGAGEMRSAPLKAGDMATNFTLADQDGRPHTFSAERGRRPVVLISYRGYW